MKLRLALAASLMALSASAARADDGKLDIDFGARARIEGIDGQFRSTGAHSDAALLLRTNLGISYDAGPLIFAGEVIDSRAYFERDASSVSTSEVNAIEPVQAYVATDFSDRFKAQAGRFTMNLGSGRLVARPNFRNTVNAFTGLRIDLSNTAGDALTAFYTLPQTRLPDDHASIQDNGVELDRERFGLQFFGAFASSSRIAGVALDASVFRLAETDAPGILTRNRHLWTIDAHLETPHKAGALDYEIEGAYQFGRERGSTAVADITDQHVSAGFVHAAIGRSFAGAWKPRVQIAADYASGDHPGGDYGRFDTLFGSHTGDFGPSSLYNAVTEANLLSVEARAEVTPSKRWDGYLAFRPLWLASDTDSFGGSAVRDASGRSGHYAGSQVEGRARYWIVPKKLRATAGAAVLFKGRFLNDAPNAPDTGDTHYGYLELALTL